MRDLHPIAGSFTVEGGNLRGYAYRVGDLGARLVVELSIDGWPVDLARADDYAPEARDVGDGCYGFGFRLSDGARQDGGSIEVRVANTGEAIGGTVALPEAEARPGTVGRCDWAGGLHVTGWLETPISGEVPTVRAIADRRVLAEVEVRGFVGVMQGAVRRAKARFDVFLPGAYADGRVHRVTLLDGQGRELAGSPLSVLALDDGVGAGPPWVGDLDPCDPRSQVLERMTRRSVPFADIEAWIARHPAPEQRDRDCAASVAVILLGETADSPPADPEALESLEAQDHAAWYAVSAPAVAGPGTFDPAAIAATLAAEGEADVVLVLPEGSRLRPGALRLLSALADAERAIVYADATVDTAAGAMPLLWPAFDPVRQREQGFAALAFAAPAAQVARALGAGASSVFALFRHAAAEATPVHLPHVLVDLPRIHPSLGVALGDAASAEAGRDVEVLPPDAETGLPRAALRPAHRDRVSAVAVIQPEPWMPDLDRIAVLSPDAVERYLISHRPITVPGGWTNLVVAAARNPSALRGAAIAAARSPHLLLLDAGIEPRDPWALREMAARLGGDAVAVSGPILSDDGLIVSAGMVLGPNFSAAPVGAGFDPEAGGYAGLLAVARSCGALDAAALLVDRAAAAQVGGFEAALFPEHLGGVDLCLKLRAALGRLVFAPRARFVRRRDWRGRGSTRDGADELSILRRRWGGDLADDPSYHPGLNFDGGPFTALAWPPRPRTPRRPSSPRLQQLNSEA